MANYNKSFNFRNGVQVDNDNFIVNKSGLVGIGTTSPVAYLDVHGISALRGNVTITGVTSSTQTFVTGISTFNDVNIGTGITIQSSTGIISATKFFGDASGMTGIFAVSADGWFIDASAGIAYTSYSIGIGTTNPTSQLTINSGTQVTGSLLINSKGGSYYSAKDFNTTIAPEFGSVADSFDIRTNNERRLVVDSQGNTGIGTTIPSDILDVRGTTKTTNLNVTGVSTIGVTSITSLELEELHVTGVSTFAGISTFNSNVFVEGTIDTDQLNVTGVSTVTGNLVVAADIVHLDDPDTKISFDENIFKIQVAGSETFKVNQLGDTNVSGTTTTGNLSVTGVTTANNTIHVKHDNTDASTVAVGNSAITGYVGQFRYGYTGGNFKYSDYESLDIINTSPGGFNFISNPDLITGSTGYPRFTWTFGEAADPKLTLLKEGYFGIGTTDPINPLQVIGISTFQTVYATSVEVLNDTTVRGNLVVDAGGYVQSPSFRGPITTTNETIILDSGANADGSEGRVNVNSYVTSGVSTFKDVFLPDNGSIGIGTTVDVTNGIIFSTGVDPAGLGSDRFTITNTGSIGIGTTKPEGAVDFRLAGITTAEKFMTIPMVSTAHRDLYFTGDNLYEGMMIYNTTLHKLNFYNGTQWRKVTDAAG